MSTRARPVLKPWLKLPVSITRVIFPRYGQSFRIKGCYQTNYNWSKLPVHLNAITGFWLEEQFCIDWFQLNPVRLVVRTCIHKFWGWPWFLFANRYSLYGSYTWSIWTTQPFPTATFHQLRTANLHSPQSDTCLTGIHHWSFIGKDILSKDWKL